MSSISFFFVGGLPPWFASVKPQFRPVGHLQLSHSSCSSPQSSRQPPDNERQSSIPNQVLDKFHGTENKLRHATIAARRHIFDCDKYWIGLENGQIRNSPPSYLQMVATLVWHVNARNRHPLERVNLKKRSYSSYACTSCFLHLSTFRAAGDLGSYVPNSQTYHWKYWSTVGQSNCFCANKLYWLWCFHNLAAGEALLFAHVCFFFAWMSDIFG